MNRNKWLLVIAFVISCVRSYAQVTSWPNINVEAKPATRWWWMGSAVDKENLTRNIKSYAEAGMGTLEITPIYGVKEMMPMRFRFSHHNGWKCCAIPRAKHIGTECKLI